RELKPLKPRMVAIVDFRSADAANRVQAHHLAWLLSNTLAVGGGRKFAVADHRAFDHDLALLHLTPEDLIPGDPLRAAAASAGADLLVIGTLDKRGSSYFLEITPVRVLDSEAFAPLSATLASTEFFESILRPLPADVPRLGAGSLPYDYKMPSCIRCPDP